MGPPGQGHPGGRGEGSQGEPKEPKEPKEPGARGQGPGARGQGGRPCEQRATKPTGRRSPSPFGSPVTHLILATGSPIMQCLAKFRPIRAIFLFETLSTFFLGRGAVGNGKWDMGNEGRGRKLNELIVW